MRKGNSSHLKVCISQSLVLLLKDKPIDKIPVLDIVEKAGVNRSTYYRNFGSKSEVIRFYYAHLLDTYLTTLQPEISAKEYFSGMFRTFLAEKETLLLLDRYHLSYLLLDEMNTRIPQIFGDDSDSVYSLYSNYHIGGVFNSFRYWLREDMATSPEMLAEKCLMFLPGDFKPFLFRSPK